MNILYVLFAYKVNMINTTELIIFSYYRRQQKLNFPSPKLKLKPHWRSFIKSYTNLIRYLVRLQHLLQIIHIQINTTWPLHTKSNSLLIHILLSNHNMSFRKLRFHIKCHLFLSHI